MYVDHISTSYHYLTIVHFISILLDNWRKTKLKLNYLLLFSKTCTDSISVNTDKTFLFFLLNTKQMSCHIVAINEK